MAPSILSFVMIIMTLFVAIEASRELIRITPRPKGDTVVRITNKVGGNAALTVHCRSKDDDLGSHTLAPDMSWEFRFNPLFFTARTLFFCSMEWPGSSHRFDAYNQERDEQRCRKECYWNVVPSGPCDSTSGQCFPWKS